MIKSITRGTVGDVSDAVLEVSGYGSDVGTLNADLREAFVHLGQVEGKGLVIRAGEDVLKSLGLRVVSELSRGLVAEVRYCGALCFLRATFTNSPDWWTVSRDAPASSDASSEPSAHGVFEVLEELGSLLGVAEKATDVIGRPDLLGNAQILEIAGVRLSMPTSDRKLLSPAEQDRMQELVVRMNAGSDITFDDRAKAALETAATLMKNNAYAPSPPKSQETKELRDAPARSSEDIGYISYPPDAARIKQGLQKAFADMGSPLGDGLVISASASALKAMMDLNLIKWGTIRPVRTLSPWEDIGASRYFLNARVVKDHTLGADIWRVEAEADQRDTPMPEKVSQGVAAPGTSASEVIQQIRGEEAAKFAKDLTFPFSQANIERMISEYEIQHGRLDQDVRERVSAEMYDGDPATVEDALIQIKRDDEFKETMRIAQAEQNRAALPADTDLAETLEKFKKGDPRSGPAAMLRSGLRLLIMDMREQNMRESVKCRDLSMAISHAEDAYLRLGAMADASLLGFKE